MAPYKLRHGLSEDPARPLHGFLEADETFTTAAATQSPVCTKSPDKSLFSPPAKR